MNRRVEEISLRNGRGKELSSGEESERNVETLLGSASINYLKDGLHSSTFNSIDKCNDTNSKKNFP